MENLLAQIANYLLTQSWQIAALTIAIAAGSLVLKNRSAHIRYLLWMIVLTKCLVPPLLTIPLAILPQGQNPEAIAMSPSPMSTVAAEAINIRPTESIELPSGLVTEPTILERLAEVSVRQRLGFAWIIGATMFALIAVIKALRVNRWLRKERKQPPNELQVDIENLFSGIGVKTFPKVWLIDGIGQPFVWGLLRGGIYLPGNFAKVDSKKSYRSILGHELAHVLRFDAAVNLLQIIAQGIFWFHPFVWWANKKIRAEREKCCDETTVAGFRVKCKDYSSAIVNILIAEHKSAQPIPSLAIAGPVKNIEDRIKTIMKPGKKFYKRVGLKAAITILMLALIAVPTTLVLAERQKKADVQVEASSETAEINDTKSIDPDIKALGEAVHKRITTYSDEETFTLQDGETARMKVKENMTDIAEILITPQIVVSGTKFHLEGLDETGKAIKGTEMTSPAIHDTESSRMGLGRTFLVDGKRFFSKIQLTPERQDDNSVVVEVKMLFAKSLTPKEVDAMLLTRGKEGQMQLDYQKISRRVMKYKQQNGHFPQSMEQLDGLVPKDVYSPTGEDYHYEPDRKRFILSSCGEDGIYGNDDDEIFISYRGGARSGQRHELYPLEESEEAGAQTETVLGERPTGNCSISGKVVSAENGEPVEHARMYLHYSGTHGSIFIDVASNGTFEFKGVPTGPFSLRTTGTAGYQDAIYNPDDKPGQYPQFSLEEGEQKSDVILEVEPAYRISGKILDENGKVPKNIDTLTVLAWIEKNNGQGYINKQSRINRDDGSYSIDGLSNRPVYVMAINWQAAKKESVYPPIYHPSTFSRNEAELITFDDQWDVKNIDIQLQKTGGLVLEGTVTDERGEPVPEAFVVVHRRDMLFDLVTAYTNEQGNYQIQGLGDGEFLVHVDAVHRGLVRTRTPIDIDSTDQKMQLDFALKQGVMISGTFINEDSDDWQIGRSYGHANVKELSELNSDSGTITKTSFSLTNFRNKYRPQNAMERSGGSFLAGQGDYRNGSMIFPTKSSFIFQGMMPGHTMITFSPKKEGQEVLEILYNGKNIMETGIDTEPGQEIKDVTIVVGTSTEAEMKSDVQADGEQANKKAVIQVEVRFLHLPAEANEFVTFFEEEKIIFDADKAVRTGLFINAEQAEQLLKLVRTNPAAKILAAPKVSVLDGESVTLRTQKTIKYEYTDPNAASGQPEQKELKIGTVIWAEPTVQADGKNILLKLDFEHTNIIGFEGGLPHIEKTKVQTHVLAPSGQTLILGGQKITDEEDGQSVSKILLCLVKAETLKPADSQTTN